MARLVEYYVPATTKIVLEFEAEDYIKQRKREEERNKFPKPTRDQLAFCKRLKPCPICGDIPEPLIVCVDDEYSIKMVCSTSSFHIGCGDWKKSFARAGKDWNKRTQDTDQIKYDRDMEKRLAKKGGKKRGRSTVQESKPD